MEIQIKRIIDYIPDWNENKKDKNPILFHLRYLSTGELEECFEVKPTRYNPNTKKVTGGEVIQHDRQMFLYAVMEIDNLEVNDGNKTTKVTTGRELLLQPGLDMLYYELVRYVKQMNARVDSKN